MGRPQEAIGQMTLFSSDSLDPELCRETCECADMTECERGYGCHWLALESVRMGPDMLYEVCDMAGEGGLTYICRGDCVMEVGYGAEV